MSTPRLLWRAFPLTLSALLAASLGSASAQNIKLTINGKPAGNAIMVGGQTYVPLSALKNAGVGAVQGPGTLSLTLGQVGGTTGGANQVAALSGCLGQTFFNGVWRVTFSNLRFDASDSTNLKWLYDVEVRNATKNSLAPVSGGLNPDSDHLSILGPDGTPFELSTGDLMAGQKLGFATLPPGGVWKGTLQVHDPNGAQASRPPVKLLWQIKPTENDAVAKLPWNVKDPSFRVDLTCKK